MSESRYAVEQDSPDGGRSTYAECWGNTATCRGRVLSEHATLGAAIRAARAGGRLDSCTWIYDRLRGCVVPRKEIVKACGECHPSYPG